jgi:hypothetical protein
MREIGANMPLQAKTIYKNPQSQYVTVFIQQEMY